MSDPVWRTVFDVSWAAFEDPPAPALQEVEAI
jgi:hypothetical protein